LGLVIGRGIHHCETHSDQYRGDNAADFLKDFYR